MSRLTEFRLRSGHKASQAEERRKFVNRIEDTVLPLFERSDHIDQYKKVFEFLCYEYGENSSLHINKDALDRTQIPNLQSFSQGDFFKTIELLLALRDYLESRPQSRLREDKKAVFDGLILAAIDKGQNLLGYKYVNGSFYPSGAEELDEVVSEAYTWLSRYPDAKECLENALSNYWKYSRGEENELNTMVHNAYLSFESLVKSVLNKKGSIKANAVKQELIDYLGLGKMWRTSLDRFFDYATDFGQHASEVRREISPIEAEAFLYQTALYIRLISRAAEQAQNNTLVK